MPLPSVHQVLTAISRPAEGTRMYDPNDMVNPLFVFSEEQSSMGSTAEINGVSVSTEPPNNIMYEPRLHGAMAQYDLPSIDLIIGMPGVTTAHLIQRDFDFTNCMVAQDLATETFHIQEFDCMAYKKTWLNEVRTL